MMSATLPFIPHGRAEHLFPALMSTQVHIYLSFPVSETRAAKPHLPPTWAPYFKIIFKGLRGKKSQTLFCFCLQYSDVSCTGQKTDLYFQTFLWLLLIPSSKTSSQVLELLRTGTPSQNTSKKKKSQEKELKNKSMKLDVNGIKTWIM
jgi:hypothetical protein